MLVFCLHFSGLTIAGDCANENDYGGPQTISENYKYTDCWNIVEPGDLAWDIDNSPPSMMDAGQSVALAVIGDNTPDTYKWSVQGGNGFSLATPDGVENTLSTTPDACGTAKITVTGCDGTTVSGTVRCTANSQWYHQGHVAPLPHYFSNYKETIYGGVKWTTYGYYYGKATLCLPESPTPAPCNAEDLKTTCIYAEDIYGANWRFNTHLNKYCWGCN